MNSFKNNLAASLKKMNWHKYLNAAFQSKIKANELLQRDVSIISRRFAERIKLNGPQIGDKVKFLDGSMSYIAYKINDFYQFGCGSCHFTSFGRLQYSGILSTSVPFWPFEMNGTGVNPYVHMTMNNDLLENKTVIFSLPVTFWEQKFLLYQTLLRITYRKKIIDRLSVFSLTKTPSEKGINDLIVYYDDYFEMMGFPSSKREKWIIEPISTKVFTGFKNNI